MSSGRRSPLFVRWNRVSKDIWKNILSKKTILIIFLKIFFIHSPSDTDSERLIDYSDTHVLDFEPNLKRMSTLAVLQNNIDQSVLPRAIQ